MLTTMLAPTSGRARVADFDVAAESRKVRADRATPKTADVSPDMTEPRNVIIPDLIPMSGSGRTLRDQMDRSHHRRHAPATEAA